MRDEINKAMSMMFRAGITKREASDVELLARDIQLVAAELAGETGDPHFFIADGARELERRIGDIHALPSYMRCLRASAKESA